MLNPVVVNVRKVRKAGEGNGASHRLHRALRKFGGDGTFIWIPVEWDALRL